MRLIDSLLPRAEERSTSGWPELYTMDQFANWFTFEAQRFSLKGSSPTMPSDGFTGYIDSIHRKSPIISAAATSRALLMSQLRFAWRNNQLSPTPGRMFGDRTLSLLERPGSMKRSAFLSVAELHGSYAGTAYPVVKDGRMYLLRPDWVTVVMGTNSDPETDINLPPADARITAIVYQPEHGGVKGRPEAFLPGEFTIWAPEPDPVYWWRGVSWVSSLIREFAVDGQVTDHQSKFFEHAATPNLVFVMDPEKTAEQVREYAAVVNEKHAGAMNAYKNMFLGGGTDVKVVGSSLDNVPLRDISGGFESRVSARSHVPAALLNTREGNSGSALNGTNYQYMRRQWADKWFTPTADSLCEALEALLPPKDDAELSWDKSRVMFLQEDEKDAADIRQVNAVALRQLVEAGYEPDSAVEYLHTGDITKLRHTGNVSVQLQPPGSGTAPSRAIEHRTEEQPQPRLELHNHTHVTRSDVTVEPPVVNVEPADVQVVNHIPEQRAETPIVQVNVDPTPVTVENRVEVDPTPVTVENQVNVDTPPAQVTVVGDDKPARFKVRRDNKGQITEVNEEG